VALLNHGMFAIHAQHNTDRLALAYLEDLWVARDPQESRAFTIEFVCLLDTSAERVTDHTSHTSISKKTRTFLIRF
jgi:hypothetical protein